MSDMLLAFQKVIREKGLDATVEHYVDAARQTNIIRVVAEINGEKLIHEQHIPESEVVAFSDVQSLASLYGREIVQGYEELLTNRVEWGEKAVEFNMKGGWSIACLRCGAEADADQIDFDPPGVKQDNPMDAVVELTLQARLRDECDPMCPNSPHDGAYRKI